MDHGIAFATDRASVVLSSLANPHRLRIMLMLNDREMDVGSIVSALGLAQSAVSQHLKKLGDAGTVRTRRNAQMIFYRLADEPITRILETTMNATRGYQEAR